MSIHEDQTKLNPNKRCKECNSPRYGEFCHKCGTKLFLPDSTYWTDPATPSLEILKDAGREVGYNIVAHGTQERDLDIVALPWTKNSVNAKELAEHLAKAIKGFVVSPEQKPFGRWSCNIQVIGWFKLIDLSVCPRVDAPNTSDSRWITQDKFYDPADPDKGNCTESSIASILGIPLDAVPVLSDPKNHKYPEEGFVYNFWETFNDFLESKGFEVIRKPGNYVPDVYYLASGPASRGCKHMVVMRAGELVHDPHPSRSGLISVEHVYLLVPKDPASMVKI